MPTDAIIIYVETIKPPPPKFLELICNYSKVAGYNANVQKSVAFLYTSYERLEFEIKNVIPFILTLEKEILRYKSDKICVRST